MIEGLSERDLVWLRSYFAAPNELDWSNVSGATPSSKVDLVRPWLELLVESKNPVPVILPFVRGGVVTGWYAAARSGEAAFDLRGEIEAWLGPTYLSLFEHVPAGVNDPMATAMRDRFGSPVFRMSGPADLRQAIADRLGAYVDLLKARPSRTRPIVRPVGAIRSEFERALIARNQPRAEELIVELKQTGRLNEENLRFLRMRLSAGLGLWPQLARDHWLIQTMSELALPPQILSDLIEALYRTYVDDIEARGDVAATLDAFRQNVSSRYPRLFSSRKGIRTSRVVKAFLLFEQLQNAPNAKLLAELQDLLTAEDRQRVLREVQSVEHAQTADAEDAMAQAEAAFDDAQFDRAMAMYLPLPLTPKSVARLIACVHFIGTAEARSEFLDVLDRADPDLIDRLPEGMRKKLRVLRIPPAFETSANAGAEAALQGWIAWAKNLQRAGDLVVAEETVQSAASTWDVSAILASEASAASFATMIANLEGRAAAVARRAVPQMFAGFLADGQAAPAAKPIAEVLFFLIAADDGLSRSDLGVLAQLLTCRLELGLTSDEYLSLIRDLEDVQDRMISHAHLAWSLDVAEALAAAPVPSEAALDARLRFFLKLVGQAQGFGHRLGPQDIAPLKFLAHDYGVEPETLSGLLRDREGEDVGENLPSLEGKTIGIYTLAHAAGERARKALVEILPTCRIELNSDLVCTSRLASLAKAADLFVFAWKSSSHQAFYCVKDALVGSEPIWAEGKGTASILRAVLENAR
jgi:hypothetical protein